MDVSSKEVMDSIKQKWAELSDGKRIKFIRRALADETRYLFELEEYKKDHPTFEAPIIRTVVTKAEQNLKDKFDGKPERPPNSGYSLFSKQMLGKIQNVDSKQKMSEIARQWKELPEATRIQYNQQAQDKIAKYAPKFQAYLEKLSPEEQAKMKDKVKIKLPSQKAEEKERKKFESVKLSDLASRAEVNDRAKTFFVEERTAALMAEGKDFGVVFRSVNDKWSELSVEDKEDYLRKAQIELGITGKARAPKQMNKIELPANIKANMPVVPPKSGYALFNKEKLRLLTHIDSKKRMTEIARMWTEEISDKEKAAINTKFVAQKDKYIKEVEKYKKTLNSADRTVFDAWLQSRMPGKSRIKKSPAKVGSGKKSPTKVDKAKVPTLPAPAVDESSDDDDDSDDNPKAVVESSEEDSSDSD
jgi:upstream-binding transcription factor